MDRVFAFLDVIHAGTAQMLFIHIKTQRFNQMQLHVKDRTGTHDVAGILRDFRFK